MTTKLGGVMTAMDFLKSYEELCKLAEETKGAHFTLSFLVREGEHAVTIVNMCKKFQHKNPVIALQEAVKWIKSTRIPAEKPTLYSLYGKVCDPVLSKQDKE